MKKILLLLLLVSSTTLHAQDENKPFKAYIFNKEYNVFLKINFYDQDIVIPSQELLGALPGYLGKLNNTFSWIITDARIDGKNQAELTLINDYGSDDLTATLTCDNDSTYTLQQKKGSALKVPKDGKWQKLPKTIVFKRTKNKK